MTPIGIDLICAATFTLGGVGGHEGRALREGDVLVPGRPEVSPAGPVPAERAASSAAGVW
jgi:urea carboxylase